MEPYKINYLFSSYPFIYFKPGPAGPTPQQLLFIYLFIIYLFILEVVPWWREEAGCPADGMAEGL